MAETKTYKVLRSMTEKEIKNLGGGMWARKHGNLLRGLVLAAVVIMLLIQYNLNNAYAGVLGIVPTVVLSIYFLVNYDKAGKDLWEKIQKDREGKDLRTPIEL